MSSASSKSKQASGIFLGFFACDIILVAGYALLHRPSGFPQPYTGFFPALAANIPAKLVLPVPGYPYSKILHPFSRLAVLKSFTEKRVSGTNLKSLAFQLQEKLSPTKAR